MKTYEERAREFMLGLAELTKKTHVAIGGCGCCGSPFLINLGKSEFTGEGGYFAYSDDMREVQWVQPSYDSWEELKDRVVRPDESNL